MEVWLLKELLAILLGALAILVVLRLIQGWLHLPAFRKNTVTLCYARGDGSDLERTVRTFRWLRGSGLGGGTLVIVDCGLWSDGLTAAQLLQKQEEWVSYCPHQTLGDYLKLLEDKI